ncbi:MBL fold metallo-hydrolase [Paraburkholderia caribensis]|uniref:MBL fold metallo-hydrolase n=1 Tax=Paraburkholderia caribensis TaxID=75105 RepID=UPI0034D33F2E
MSVSIHPFFDSSTSTFSYVVHAADDARCAIVDSVMGFELRSGTTSTDQVQRIARFVERQGLHVEWLLETHVHADHLSGAAWLRDRVGGRIGISERIVDVQKIFKQSFNLEDAFLADGSDFDYLFKPDERFSIGNLDAVAMSVPGHTPADVAYKMGDEAVFVGDTLFMPDVGTARCDFPGGDAGRLFDSVRRILALNPETKLYMCHDYPPATREAQFFSDVATQREANIHLRDGVDAADFIKMRTTRDAGLSLPKLFFPSIQINIRAGHFPQPEGNGMRYLKLPIDQF